MKVISNYKTTLSASMTSSQNTVPVTDITTTDGHTITTTDIDNYAYLVIEPGSANMEIIKVTGISGSTWTGAVRGLAFYGDVETSVAGNQKAHQSGSTVIMSNSHYYFSNFVDKNHPEAISTYTPTTPYQLTTKTWVENRNGFWEGAVADYAALVAITTDADGAARVTLDDSKLYVWDLNTTTWNLAGAGGGAGTVYITTKLGTEAVGDDNKTFQLDSGSFPDKKYLQVYKNGVLMGEGATNDYLTSNSNQAVFNEVVLDDDVITLLVVSVDIYNPSWNSVNADVLPDVDNTYDIGSTAKKFKNAKFAGSVTAGSFLGDGSTLDDGANGKLTSGTTANKLVRVDSNNKISQSLLDLNYFGDGSDGDVTISTNETLTADKQYNNLTINNGVTLNPGGYKIFVRGTLTNNGTIARVGNNGTNAVANTQGVGGAALSPGTLYGALAGGDGGAGGINGGGSAGVNGANRNPSTTGVNGVSGGAGGGNAGTSGTGGTGGTATSETVSFKKNSLDISAAAISLNTENTQKYLPIQGIYGSSSAFTLATSAGCGGGGGGAASNPGTGGGGGGAGGNGGIVYVSARILINNGTISVKGGNGGNGANGTGSTAGGGGGGAGGNGGLLILVYTSLTAGTLTYSGGSFGTGGTGVVYIAGANGTAGNAGKYIQVLIS